MAEEVGIDRPMIKPVRLQLSRRKGFDLQTASRAINGLPAVNCARPGKLGNPFVVGRDGTRAYCVKLYRMLMSGLICLTCEASIEEQRAARDYFLKNRRRLRGKNMGCWCHGDPCHVDTQLELANAPVLRSPTGVAG